jgi:hypothetical protein
MEDGGRGTGDETRVGWAMPTDSAWLPMRTLGSWTGAGYGRSGKPLDSERPAARNTFMSTKGWLILAAANLPVYWFIGWVIFTDLATFWECVKFWLTPDWISWIRGAPFDDWWGELRLGYWALLCALAVYGESFLLARLGVI